MIAAIAADGDALQPMIVIHRQTVDEELRVLGYTNSALILAHSPTGYVNTKIFESGHNGTQMRAQVTRMWTGDMLRRSAISSKWRNS